MPQRTIAVLGATGNQGGSVVRSLLSATTNPDSGPWLVRAVSQDPALSKTQKFLTENQTQDKRLTVAFGDVYDAASLRDAFADAYGVFAITHEAKPGEVITEEEDLLHEIEAGRNIVRAVKECGVAHLLFSGLPDMVKATGGRFKGIHHMNNKHAIEQIARKELDGFTVLIPGFFFTNMRWPQYSRRQADGVVRFCAPIPGGQFTQWTDPTYDMGVFAERIFALGVEKTAGKTYLALSPRIRIEEMAETFTRVTGQPVIQAPTSLDEFGELTWPFVGPAFKEDVMQMMEWAAMVPDDKICYGSMDPEEDRSAEELGVKASTFEDWLRRSKWNGPEDVYQGK